MRRRQLHHRRTEVTNTREELLRMVTKLLLKTTLFQKTDIFKKKTRAYRFL